MILMILRRSVMELQFCKSEAVNLKASFEGVSKRSSLLELTQKINDLIEVLDDFNISRGINFLDIAKLNYLNNTILACLTEFAYEDKEKLTETLSWLLKQSSDMLLIGIQRVDNNFIKLKELMANIERHSFRLHAEIKPSISEN